MLDNTVSHHDIQLHHKDRIISGITAGLVTRTCLFVLECGFNIQIEGETHIRTIAQDVPIVFMANHLSGADPWIISPICSRARGGYAPKNVVWNFPKHRPELNRRSELIMTKFLRCIFIDPNSRQWLKKGTAAIENGGMALIFPEGTRSRENFERVKECKGGATLLARTAKAVIIPIGIIGPEMVLPIGRKIPRFGQTIAIVFGEPIHNPKTLDEITLQQTIQRLVNRAIALRDQNQSTAA